MKARNVDALFASVAPATRRSRRLARLLRRLPWVPRWAMFRWGRFWIHAPLEDGYYTIPWNDEIKHELEDCICGPTEKLEQCNEGHDHWTYTHHAIDGRGDVAVPPKETD